MSVVTKRDQIQRAFGRLFTHQRVKAAFAKNLFDRADPVGPFGMSRWRQMVEACPMRQQKCCHAGIRPL